MLSRASSIYNQKDNSLSPERQPIPVTETEAKQSYLVKAAYLLGL